MYCSGPCAKVRVGTSSSKLAVSSPMFQPSRRVEYMSGKFPRKRYTITHPFIMLRVRRFNSVIIKTAPREAHGCPSKFSSANRKTVEKDRSNSHGLSFILAILISSKAFGLGRLELVQRDVLPVWETAELVHADVALGVPPGLLPRFCVGNSQGNLYVLASYI